MIVRENSLAGQFGQFQNRHTTIAVSSEFVIKMMGFNNQVTFWSFRSFKAAHD